ncbi:MAG: TIGR04222 domain-containing membrane protein [Luteolibacter sp.]
MTAPAHWMTLAEIPILDWKGPQFLIFYLVALVICVVWSFIRARQAMSGFQVSDQGMPPLTNPYEIAYLAGGAPRVVQLVVVRLVSEDLLEWKKSGSVQGLVSSAKVAPTDLNEVERMVLKSAGSFGKTGMQLRNVADAITGPLGQIERRLAILGLRPTASEGSGAGFKAALPLLFLMGIGIAKLCIGLSREKPVLFLVFLLFLSFILLMVIVSRTPRLTAKGTKMLDSLHADHADLEKRVQARDAVSNQDASIALSLLGPACLIGMGGYLGIDPLLSAQLRTLGANNSGSGCSTSSGCSSGGGDGGGGCGGGGCGGCGGGGD